MKYFLYVNFFEKEQVKLLNAKWDPQIKKWYFEGDALTPELQPYEETVVDIAYEDKDEYKEKFSIKWDAVEYKWITSAKVADEIAEFALGSPLERAIAAV